jgi:hypothetical protein
MTLPAFIGPPFCAACGAEGVKLREKKGRLYCSAHTPLSPSRAGVSTLARIRGGVLQFLEGQRIGGDPLATLRRQVDDLSATERRYSGPLHSPRVGTDLVSRLRAPTTLAHGLSRMWRGEDGE